MPMMPNTKLVDTGRHAAFPGAFQINEEAYAPFIRNILKGLAKNDSKIFIILNVMEGGTNCVLQKSSGAKVAQWARHRTLVINLVSYASDCDHGVFKEGLVDMPDSTKTAWHPSDWSNFLCTRKIQIAESKPLAYPKTGTWFSLPFPFPLLVCIKKGGIPNSMKLKPKNISKRWMQSAGLIKETNPEVEFGRICKIYWCKILRDFEMTSTICQKLIYFDALFIPTQNFQNKDFNKETIREGRVRRLPFFRTVQFRLAGFKCVLSFEKMLVYQCVSSNFEGVKAGFQTKSLSRIVRFWAFTFIPAIPFLLEFSFEVSARLLCSSSISRSKKNKLSYLSNAWSQVLTSSNVSGGSFRDSDLDWSWFWSRTVWEKLDFRNAQNLSRFDPWAPNRIKGGFFWLVMDCLACWGSMGFKVG